MFKMKLGENIFVAGDAVNSVGLNEMKHEVLRLHSERLDEV